MPKNKGKGGKAVPEKRELIFDEDMTWRQMDNVKFKANRMNSRMRDISKKRSDRERKRSQADSVDARAAKCLPPSRPVGYANALQPTACSARPRRRGGAQRCGPDGAAGDAALPANKRQGVGFSRQPVPLQDLHREVVPPEPLPYGKLENPAPLMEEHYAMMAAFLASGTDAGAWRAVNRAAKASAQADGPFAAALSEAGQASLIALEIEHELKKMSHEVQLVRVTLFCKKIEFGGLLVLEKRFHEGQKYVSHVRLKIEKRLYVLKKRFCPASLIALEIEMALHMLRKMFHEVQVHILEWFQQQPAYYDIMIVDSSGLYDDTHTKFCRAALEIERSEMALLKERFHEFQEHISDRFQEQCAYYDRQQRAYYDRLMLLPR